MKKIEFKMKIDTYTEKAIENFCRENRITVEKFLEEAIYEKLEAEEQDGVSFFSNDLMDLNDNEVSESLQNESDNDLYRKKH